MRGQDAEKRPAPGAGQLAVVRASPGGQPNEILAWFGNTSLKRFITDQRLAAKAAALPYA